jgi:hypothetical protein
MLFSFYSFPSPLSCHTAPKIYEPITAPASPKEELTAILATSLSIVLSYKQYITTNAQNPKDDITTLRLKDHGF